MNKIPYPSLSHDTLNLAGGTLERYLKNEREARGLKGYWFDFGDGCTYKHGNAGAQFRLSCSEMVRCAKDDRARIELYKNGLDNIACRLVKTAAAV